MYCKYCIASSIKIYEHENYILFVFVMAVFVFLEKIEIGFFQSPFRCAGAVMYNDTSDGEQGYFCGSLGKC